MSVESWGLAWHNGVRMIAFKKLKFKHLLGVLILSGAFQGCKNEESPQGGAKTETLVKKIRIGILPNERSKNLKLFTSELSKKIGVGVEIEIPKAYEGLVSDFKDGKIDFAFLPPLNTIQLEKDVEAKILLKKVYGKSEFYYSGIVVRAGSPLKKLKDLQSKKFGFVDPKSTSGYLYPRALLKQAGVDLKTQPHEFLGTHGDAVTALLAKKVDAIGIWVNEPGSNKGAWDQVPGVSANQLKILQVSEPIPNDSFTVRKIFYSEHPSLVLKVMDSLISLGDGPNSVLKQVFDVDGMATATSRHYDSVRAYENFLKDESVEK